MQISVGKSSKHSDAYYELDNDMFEVSKPRAQDAHTPQKKEIRDSNKW
jgi:hypothetical protein